MGSRIMVAKNILGGSLMLAYWLYAATEKDFPMDTIPYKGPKLYLGVWVSWWPYGSSQIIVPEERYTRPECKLHTDAFYKRYKEYWDDG